MNYIGRSMLDSLHDVDFTATEKRRITVRRRKTKNRQSFPSEWGVKWRQASISDFRFPGEW